MSALTIPDPRTPSPRDAPVLRWGILGLGRIATQFAESLRHSTGQAGVVADAAVHLKYPGGKAQLYTTLDTIQWVGVGTDSGGRLLEYIAVEDEPDGWLIFRALPATKKVLIEVGLRR